MVFGVLPEEDIGVNHDRLSRQAECILDRAEEVEALVPKCAIGLRCEEGELGRLQGKICS